MQIACGSEEELHVDTVGAAKSVKGLTEGYTALVNGEAAGDDYRLRDGDSLTIAKAVKGGRK